MNKEKLEQLRAMKQELDTLCERYLRMPPAEEVGDTYGDYRTGHKVVKVIQGASAVRSIKLKEKITVKRAALEKEILKLEEFLDSVDDSQMRDILRLYYAEGLSQGEIGRRKGYSRSAIGYKIDSFWNNNIAN